MEILAAAILFVLLGVRAVQNARLRQREVSRFASFEHQGVASDRFLDRCIDYLAQGLARNHAEARMFIKDSRMSLMLQTASLESASGTGRYLALQLLGYVSWLLITVGAWQNFARSYAIIVTLCGFASVIVVPHLWLRRRMTDRRVLIERELPLFISLFNMGVAAGWDLPGALDRVIEALVSEYPKHPLVSELRVARWLTSTGFTWPEALERMERRIADDSITRVTRALVQGIGKGGDRLPQFERIAEDAQRIYALSLDKRLAAVPMQLFMVTIILSVSYFAVLVLPARF